MLNPRIELSALLRYLDDIDQKYGERNDAQRMVVAANFVFKAWLGPDWFTKRVTHPFFNPRRRGHASDDFLQQAAIVWLAECLLNLQHIEGVEKLAKSIGGGKKLDDDMAELAGAALLHRAGITEMRFVGEQGAKGLDYDVEATLGGERVCFEMKNKIADPSVGTVVATVRKAVYQVPADTPNVLVLQPSREWVTTEEGFRALEAGIEEAFRKYDRFARVVVHQDEWRPVYRRDDDKLVGAAMKRRILVYIHEKPAVPFPVAVSGRKWLEETGLHWLTLEDAIAKPARRKELRDFNQSLEMLRHAETAAEQGPLLRFPHFGVHHPTYEVTLTARAMTDVVATSSGSDIKPPAAPGLPPKPGSPP